MATIDNIHEQIVQYKQYTNDNEFDRLNPLKSALIHGFSSIKQSNYDGHLLEKFEKTRNAREEYRDLTILRSVQGIQAPLRLLFERKAASKIGHLPFLTSSNLMMDVLTGRDEMLLPEDILDHPREFCEVQLPPHMTVERSLNIL